MPSGTRAPHAERRARNGGRRPPPALCAPPPARPTTPAFHLRASALCYPRRHAIQYRSYGASAVANGPHGRRESLPMTLTFGPPKRIFVRLRTSRSCAPALHLEPPPRTVYIWALRGPPAPRL